MRALVLALLLAIAAPAAARDAAPCSSAAPCAVESGRYVARPPAGWDGRSPLPVLVFFHGFGDEPAKVLETSGLPALADAEGFLLVLPEGLNRRWHARLGQDRPRDDVAFIRAVLDDLRARYAIDPARVVASGYSAGGFMTWRLACEAPGLFAAFLPVKGAFLGEVPSGPCPAGPVTLRHVHADRDTVVPMAGRALSAGLRQADARASLAVMLATDRCVAAPSTARQAETTCTTWDGCAGGHALSFCVISAGHAFDVEDIAAGWRWLRARGVLAGR